MAGGGGGRAWEVWRKKKNFAQPDQLLQLGTALQLALEVALQLGTFYENKKSVLEESSILVCMVGKYQKEKRYRIIIIIGKRLLHTLQTIWLFLCMLTHFFTRTYVYLYVSTFWRF